MKRFVKVFLAGIAGVALSTGAANAATIIDFETGGAGAGGTLTIGANITGSGIFINSVTIAGALFNNGTYDVDGAGVCTAADGSCGILSFDRNANTISLVGYIPALGILAPVNLLLGDLSGGVFVVTNSGTVGFVNLSGLDVKSRELLLAIGLDPLTQFGYFGSEIGFNLTGGGSPYTAVSTDIINSSVPEPGSIALFGTGLFGLAAAVRRRLGKKA